MIGGRSLFENENDVAEVIEQACINKQAVTFTGPEDFSGSLRCRGPLPPQPPVFMVTN
jgi:hypothetical protein